MLRQVILTGLVAATLTGCANIRSSKLNPLNWFGASEPVVVTESGETVKVLQTLAPRKGYPVFTDTRPLVPSVDSLRIEKSASGAIVVATTTLPALGYYDAELVPVPSDQSGTLRLEFRIRPPQEAVGSGAASHRRIQAARAVSFEDLEGISRVVVLGANGARQARR